MRLTFLLMAGMMLVTILYMSAIILAPVYVALSALQ